jgi:hypothetical protein
VSGGGFYTALSGAIAQSEALDAVSSNVANAATPGYKAERVSFEQALVEAEKRDGASVRATRGARDGSVGPVQHTGAPLDLMLEGAGHFVVAAGDGLGPTAPASTPRAARSSIAPAARSSSRRTRGTSASTTPVSSSPTARPSRSSSSRSIRRREPWAMRSTKSGTILASSAVRSRAPTCTWSGAWSS